jgi:ubiquinone/menaquinone biosynthesis C-methylase UbiE
MAHKHEGKSSESLIDKTAILDALSIKPHQHIIDAGCGNGYMSKEFSKLLGNTGKVYALDPDTQAIKQLKNEVFGTNIEPLEADITKPTPIKTATADLVYLSTVFHGFSHDQIAGFQMETARVLKPGGKLAIIEIKKEVTPFGPPMEIRFSPEELKHTLSFTPKKLIDVGDYFYMQIFENTIK